MPDRRVPDWLFVRRQPMSKQRDPMQGEFFNTESIKGAADEVVREAIQNVLDAGDEPQVRVRIYVSGVSGALSAAVAAPYFDGLKEHAVACGAPESLFTRPCRFVVVEDFGTTGLCGDETSYEEPPPSQRNDFFYFFRAEGKTGKSGTDRGRWGVGKYVFPKASNANTFFALTARRPDGPDEPGPLLMGQAVMKNHKLGNVSYEPDGWWAVLTRDDVPVPARDAGAIADFRSTWNVERYSEPGLSVVIPYADEALSVQQLRRSVIRDYFVAILAGQLTVDIETADSDETVTINSETLDDVIAMLDENEREQVRRNADLVRWALSVADADVVTLTAPSDSPSWSPELIAPDLGARIRDIVTSGGRVVIRVPVNIKAKASGLPRKSWFDVLLAAEDGLRRLPMFIREGIIVSEAVRSGALQGIRAIVLVRDGALADLLGDAEGPAHTSWSSKTERFIGKYLYGAQWLIFVRQAPAKILEIARGEDDAEDRTIAVDLFWLPGDAVDHEPDQVEGDPTDADPGNADPANADPGNDSTDPLLPSPPPTDRRINTTRDGNGFTVTLTPHESDVDRIEVLTAYDRRRGNPFKKWTKEDFDLAVMRDNMDVQLDGGTFAECSGNRIVVDVTDHGNFALRVRGFDVNRDLRVNAHEREVV